MTRINLMACFVLTALAPSLAVGEVANGEVSTSKHLRQPGRIPKAALALLDTRMGKHGDDLEWLLANVLMLNREKVEASATRIAQTPKLARPQVKDADLLNALLPVRFFDLQDELADRANTLAAAAHSRDDRAIAKAFGRLTETCVACHSIYLEDSLSPKEEDLP